MLRLIERRAEFASGYREYCRELHESGAAVWFRPTDPAFIDADWFARTKPIYDRKERESGAGRSPSFHYWAVDGERFIGEFQLRTAFTENVLRDIGSVGFAVRPPEWGKGCGTEILRQGLEIAVSRGMDKVLLTIAPDNAASIRVCEKLGGTLGDTIMTADGRLLRRYWIAPG